MSFTNMAKIAGERWQNPEPEERAFCERQAQELKEEYYAKLAEYKETPAYARYQEYLADFKARHSDPRTQSKSTHSSLDLFTETSQAQSAAVVQMTCPDQPAVTSSTAL